MHHCISSWPDSLSETFKYSLLIAVSHISHKSHKTLCSQHLLILHGTDDKFWDVRNIHRPEILVMPYGESWINWYNEKRSKTLPGDHFAMVSLAVAKGIFLGEKKKKTKHPLRNLEFITYMSCTYIRTAEKEIVARFKKIEHWFKIITKRTKVTFIIVDQKLGRFLMRARRERHS